MKKLRGALDIRDIIARIEEIKELRSDCCMPSRVLTNPEDPSDLLGGDWWEDENPQEAEELDLLELILADFSNYLWAFKYP